MRREAPGELIARARENPDAFGELYDLYLARVYAFCRKYAASSEEAEDLTAHTFERALRAIGQYQDRGAPFSAWLLRIASHAIIDRSRRAGSTPLLDGDMARLRDESFPRRWEDAYWMRVHVEALPRDQREAIRLRFYEDQRIQDVAQRMGRSDGAVKQLLRRALRALHVQIEAEREEERRSDD